jgi:hypothetical protein
MVPQEMNTRTRDLAADLTGHITQTNNDVVVVRQEMAKLAEQISSKVTEGVNPVSDNVIECRNQILAEKGTNLLKFQKVNQELEVLKVRLGSKQASGDPPAFAGSSEQSTVIDVNKTSQNTSAAPVRGGETNGGQCVPTHSDGETVELSHITNAAVVNASSKMPTNRESLSELSLPSFVDCNKQ